MPFPSFLRRPKSARQDIADNKIADKPRKKKDGFVRRLFDRSGSISSHGGQITVCLDRMVPLGLCAEIILGFRTPARYA